MARPEEPAPLASPDGDVEAIWQVQRFVFEYRSAEIFYSCDLLETKLRAILAALGARSSLAVETRCRGKTRNWIEADIVLVTPMPATEANIHAATSFNSRDELVARVRGIELPGTDSIERFRAQWQEMSLSHLQGAFLTGEDCELLRSVVDQIFPRLAVRVTRSKLRCDGAARARPALEVQVLLPGAVTASL